jgi:hypothetical protein
MLTRTRLKRRVALIRACLVQEPWCVDVVLRTAALSFVLLALSLTCQNFGGGDDGDMGERKGIF